MQKNNKNNKALDRAKETKIYFLILLMLLMYSACGSVVSYAERLDIEEDLIVRVAVAQKKIANLADQSVLAGDAINYHEAWANTLQAQLDEANANLIELQGQSDSLLTLITAADSKAPMLSAGQLMLNSEINALNIQLFELAQQRVDSVSASVIKSQQLASNLSLAQRGYANLQELGSEFLSSVDNRLAALNQYLTLVSSRQLGAYIQRYINLLGGIRSRYVAKVDNLKGVYSNKISQLQEELQQLQVETTLLLTALDQQGVTIENTIAAKIDEKNRFQTQAVLLNEEKIASQREQVLIANSLNSLQERVTQISADLEMVSLKKAQLTDNKDLLATQTELLQVELSRLLAQQAAMVAVETRKQSIAEALLALSTMDMHAIGRCQANQSGIFPVACFESDKHQIVRITHSQLLAMGVDLSGVPKHNIGALSNGHAVPIFVSADDLFDESSFIEVIAEGNDTIYSDNRSYLIYVDFSEEFALSATQSDSDFNVYGQADDYIFADTYTEIFHYEKDDFYSISGLSDFGWTDSDGFHYLYAGQNKTVTTVFELDSQAQLDSYANLVVKFSKSAFVNDSVKTVVYLNGLPLGEGSIDQPGKADTRLELELAPGILQLGENSFSIFVSNIGADRLSFQFDEFTLSYQRLLLAKENAIEFIADGSQYLVSGFDDVDAQSVVVFKQSSNGQVERMMPMLGGSLDAAFVIETSSSTLVTIDAVNSRVELSLPRSYQDIMSPHAEYLIISHPDFVDTQAMVDIVNLRQQEYSVQVVDVDQIYAQYSQGSFDAQAIKQFIGDKIAHSSTKMILLVGDDTYDYKNRLGTGEESFIPSLYLMYPQVMAADSIYVDHNDDQLPDVAIGRFPVETVDEFSNMVNKTILFSQTTYSKKAVLATNYSDGYGESHYHPLLNSVFHSSWLTVDALMTQDTVEERDSAKSILVDSISYRGGNGLMVYTGHNSYATSPMFTSLDIPLLINQDFPTTAVMIDSFTGFYVADQFTDAIGVQAEDFLVADGIGAAAVFAPSSTVSLQAVQTRFIWQITRNNTYGEAYLNAMQVSYRSNAASYNLLGDPGLRLNTL